MLATQFRNQLEKILDERIAEVGRQLEDVALPNLSKMQGEISALRRVRTEYMNEAAEKAENAGR